MSSWFFTNLGASCAEQDREYVKQLLECFGTDFRPVHESETGCISDRYRPHMEGTTDRTSYEVLRLYLLANTLFDGVTVFYATEFGNNTSDYYSREETIYDPVTKKAIIGEARYCYGTSEVFGKSVYVVLREQIEKAAMEQGVAVKWNRSKRPATKQFQAFCDGYIDSVGGLWQIGRQQREEDIPSEKIIIPMLRRILTKASRLGYTRLADMINEKFDVPPTAKQTGSKASG